MHVYEVTPGIYKIFSYIASFKTYSTGYFSKQQNETGYFCGMTLTPYHKNLILCKHSSWQHQVQSAENAEVHDPEV